MGPLMLIGVKKVDFLVHNPINFEIIEIGLINNKLDSFAMTCVYVFLTCYLIDVRKEPNL